MRRTSKSGIGTTSGFGLGAHSRDEMDSIHYTTLQILQDTGIKVMSEKALKVFHGGGASVERIGDYGIVKLPSYLIEDCTHWAPRSTVYDARNPNDDYVAEPNRVGFTTFGGCINVIDPATRQLRQATKKDCGEIARVCDYLDAEMIRMIQTATRGVTISDETLAFDVIHEVGPGGAYISHDHTFKSMRSQSRAEFFDRRSRGNWMKKTGSKTMTERVYEAVAKILEEHQPHPLPDGAAEKMKEMVMDFEKEQGWKSK